MKTILVDMSATLIHHGHIRLLKSAKEMGKVVVALTTDEEIKKHKGYQPELSYKERFEILMAIKYVDDVIPSPWLLTEKELIEANANYLLHGSDNSNLIPKERLILLPRTKGISSTLLRRRVVKSLISKYLFNLKKFIKFKKKNS